MRHRRSPYHQEHSDAGEGNADDAHLRQLLRPDHEGVGDLLIGRTLGVARSAHALARNLYAATTQAGSKYLSAGPS
jgi:hypothetical protein